MFGRRIAMEATAWDDNDSVRIGSLTPRDTGSINGCSKSSLFSPRGSWGEALPGSSWEDPQRPQPSISADEEKEDTRKDIENQEGGRGFGPPFSQDSRLLAIEVLGRNARFAPTPDYIIQETSDQGCELSWTKGKPGVGGVAVLIQLSSTNAARKWKFVFAEPIPKLAQKKLQCRPPCKKSDNKELAESLLNSAAGNTSSGDRSSPISSLGRVSVEPLAGSPGAAASRSPTSIGSEEKETEQDEDGRNQKGKEEGLGPRFDQPTRLHVLQALTRGGDAATTPDSLPQAMSIIMRQQGVLRGVLDTNNDLCRNVEALECNLQRVTCENQHLRRERDSMKRQRDAFECTLASFMASGSATAATTTRAQMSPEVEDACAVTKSKSAAARSLIEKVRRQQAEAKGIDLPLSRDEKALTARESAGIGPEDTPSTSSMTPPEDSAPVPAQNFVAEIGAFSMGAQQEVRAVIGTKERASDRSDDARHPTRSTSGVVGRSAGPVRRSSAHCQPPISSSRDVRPSVNLEGHPSGPQSTARTAPPARVGAATRLVHHSHARRQPAVVFSGEAGSSGQPIGRLPAPAPHKQTTGRLGGGGSSTHPVHDPLSRRSATVASSRGVGSSARPTTRPPARRIDGLTHSCHRPLTYLDGTKASRGRVRYPITSSAPRGMAF